MVKGTALVDQLFLGAHRPDADPSVFPRPRLQRRDDLLKCRAALFNLGLLPALFFFVSSDALRLHEPVVLALEAFRELDVLVPQVEPGAPGHVPVVQQCCDAGLLPFQIPQAAHDGQPAAQQLHTFAANRVRQQCFFTAQLV